MNRSTEIEAPAAPVRPEVASFNDERWHEVLLRFGFSLATSERVYITNVLHGLTEDCMRAAGWRLFNYSTNSEPQRIPEVWSAFGEWVEADVASAKEKGYGFADLVSHSAAPPHEGGLYYERTLTGSEKERFYVDFFGTDNERITVIERDGFQAGRAGGGCYGRATAEVWGDVRQLMIFEDMHSVALDGVLAAVNNNELVAASLGRWRDCMAASGFAFPNPAAAVGAAFDLAARGDRSSEVDIAVADAECKTTSGLRDTAGAILIREIEEATAAEGSSFDRYGTFQREALGRAVELYDSVQDLSSDG